MAVASLPLEIGSTGDDAADLQRRLRAAGFEPGRVDGTFDTATRRAVEAFQEDAGLPTDGQCGPVTWSALVEAGYGFGIRLLCLRSPMMRGNDVSELQLRLGALGFDAGRVDGIFGPTTQHAVGEFQRNAGLVRDEVCGPETVGHLLRLRTRGGTASVAGVREREHLRHRSTTPADVVVALGSHANAAGLIEELAGELDLSGRRAVLVAGDWHDQAAATNQAGADAYLTVVVVDEPTVEASYFASHGFESAGGLQLANILLNELPVAPGWAVGAARGRVLPILRETRPPAVVLRLGSAEIVDANRDLVIASLVRSIDAWSDQPC